LFQDLVAYVRDSGIRRNDSAKNMKKFYITTSIAYTNASPHIGFALESIQADVLARYHRSQGVDVYFLTGTDEHGSKIAQAAEAKGKTAKEFVDEISGEFKDLKKVLNLSWDGFIRTSDKKQHWPAVHAIWNKLQEQGDIYKKTYEGLYCTGCEAFYTEKELEDGNCPIHKKPAESVKEENYFFKLSKYSQEIEHRIKNNELRIVPESRKNEILSLLKEGLTDISVSRPADKVHWGIPVPGDESQLIYVWIDALTNYVSGIGYGIEDKKDRERYETYWPADVHLIGKDILRFHAGIWPGILLAAGLPLPKSIYVHGYILHGGQKMSKSLGNVVSPMELVEKYGADPVRYFLLREIASTEDGDYTEEKFISRYNGELANGLGNFSARVLTLASKEDFELSTEEYGTLIDDSIKHRIADAERTIKEKVDAFRLHEAIGAIWEVVTFGDLYVNEMTPWKLEGEEKKKAMANLLFILESVTQLLESFLPDTAEKIAKNIERNNGRMEITKGENLFPRLQ
jgi:methionyl-tRNA synthetase